MEFSLDTASQKLHLKQAILLYGSTESSAKSTMSFASIHAVANIGNDSQPDVKILPGTPLTRDALFQSLGAVAKQYEVSVDLIPEHLLSYSPMHLLWWMPAGKRAVYFNAAEIGKTSKVVAHPAMVFMLFGGRWFVFALKANKRPSLKTELYHAPYFNVYDDGSICVGSTSTPNDTSPSAMSGWENAFFQSEFTHQNGKKRKLEHPEGSYGFWKEHLNLDRKTFPTNVLVKQGAVLGDILASARPKVVS